MRIALMGYGKMGKKVEEIALSRGHQILVRMTSEDQDWGALQDVDLGIDFSHPEAVLEHVKQAGQYHKNLVIGTTGWEKHQDEVKALTQELGIGVLYAPNFSVGVHLFLKVLESAARLMNHFPEYDVGVMEYHHSQKKDAPSGTALEMCRRLKKEIERLDSIPTSSVRVGSILGKHQVLFDSPFDTITLCHEARSRDGFALGALEAAEWLLGKKGFLTLEDFIQGRSQ